MSEQTTKNVVNGVCTIGIASICGMGISKIIPEDAIFTTKLSAVVGGTVLTFMLAERAKTFVDEKIAKITKYIEERR